MLQYLSRPVGKEVDGFTLRWLVVLTTTGLAAGFFCKKPKAEPIQMYRAAYNGLKHCKKHLTDVEKKR